VVPVAEAWDQDTVTVSRQYDTYSLSVTDMSVCYTLPYGERLSNKIYLSSSQNGHGKAANNHVKPNLLS
jgi:hypothetical protein